MKTKFNFRFLLAMLVGIFMSANVFAQDLPVTGTIIDDFGEPVLGANVVVKGTTNGATTDLDGNFSFKAPKGSTIVISFIGYTSQEVIFDGSPINVTLKEDSELLEDVVVIGYGVARKNDLTGSVTAIKPDEKNKGVITSPQDMMQGKIAGVNVTSNSGQPGGGATIRVRGGSSLNASNDPLIVIDGMAMDNQGIKGSPNALSLVNPNDIESFTVLKDASATAIYGSRGSNGVIIITTKKGSMGTAPKISYSGNVSVSTNLKKMDVLDGDEYRAFIKSYYGADSQAAKLLGTANTDWQDEIYQTAVSHEHNVTVAGGFKNLPYRFTVGYLDQEGTVKTSDYKRTTASLNLNPSFLDNHLKLTFNGKFMYSRSSYANTSAIGAATTYDPTQPVYADQNSANQYNAYYGLEGADAIGVDAYKNFNGYYTWLGDGAALDDPTWAHTANANATDNPVALLNEKSDIAHSRAWQGNVEADYKIHGFEDLRLHMSFAADYANGSQHTTYEPWGPSNIYYGNDGASSEEKFHLTYSAYAQYMKDFNEDNHFDIMVGYEWSHLKYWGSSYYAGLYPSTNRSNAGQAYNPSTSEWMSESYLVSFYGRMNYSLKDRYLLTVTVRDDGSSRFNEHWALFPSVALGWKIKDEAFLRDVDWLSEAKVRLGWGQTGQQDGIGDYNYFASYDVNSTNANGRYPLVGVGDGSGLMYRPAAYNKDLKWETTTTSNVGMDFGFLNDRFTLNLDYYYRKTTDLINTASVSAGSNFRNQVTSNIGSLKNQGFELATTIRPIQSKNWNWEVNFNLTYNQNEIIELNGESSIIRNGGISSGTGNQVRAYCAGQPAYSFYVYQQVYDEAGNPLEGVFVDRNGDGQISTDDLYFYKQADAPLTAGFSSRLSYKDWDFGFSLRASVGNYVYNDNAAGKSNVSKRFDSSYNYLQNVTPEAVQRNWCSYSYVTSDYFVQNASFLKCDNITLGYSFDKLFKGDSFKGLGGRVFLTASNVFTITKYDGLDPEVYGGIDNNLYPRPFTMQLGLSLNF